MEESGRRNGESVNRGNTGPGPCAQKALKAAWRRHRSPGELVHPPGFLLGQGPRTGHFWGDERNSSRAAGAGGTPEKTGQSCGPPRATAGSTTKGRQPQREFREDRAALSHTTFSSSGKLMFHKSTKAKSQTKLSLERKEEQNQVPAMTEEEVGAGKSDLHTLVQNEAEDTRNDPGWGTKA